MFIWRSGCRSLGSFLVLSPLSRRFGTKVVLKVSHAQLKSQKQEQQQGVRCAAAAVATKIINLRFVPVLP
ncbi:Hypothetical protein NTJ_15382 [Nesidiocoris tenuis]|uniref:Secreted protein n=1 Tax=Nesidiocoris tenuis TaxID=355587 RepID=A0ABN7BE68_9HEMI|nr:Hypothetical protein NTJ_15382 [Nesidiocoris tenuis]